MYKNYVDVIVSIQNLITAYTIRGDKKIVEGLEMALQQVLCYKDTYNIFDRQGRLQDYGTKFNEIYIER